MTETLKEKTAKGLFWGGMNNGVLQLVGALVAIILGRLLSTHDYGMLAIISVYSLIATALQESGFKIALANIQHPADKDYNSVFWFNIIVGCSAYIILFFCAPLIALFYPDEDAASIVQLCRYAFLSIIIASFGTAQGAFLYKNLMAKQQAKASIAAVMISNAIGITMAFLGCGYWSLASQGLAYVFVNTSLLWYYSPWRPHFEIDFAPVRRMFRFSCKILATTITMHINNNVLNLLLGRYFGTSNAGIYNQAYQWDFKCFSLVQNMVNQVAQPVLVDLKNDGERQLKALRKLMRFTAFISFPLLFGFGLVAKEFIVITIGTKWLASAELVRILCIAGATMPLSTLLSNMILSKGRSGTYFLCTLALCVAQIVTMLLIYPLGIRTMVVAYVVINVIWLFVWYFFTHRLTGYRAVWFIKDTVPFALAALGIMALTHLVTASIEALWLLFIVRIAMAVLLYYAVMRIARVQILAECMQFVMTKINKNSK